MNPNRAPVAAREGGREPGDLVSADSVDRHRVARRGCTAAAAAATAGPRLHASPRIAIQATPTDLRETGSSTYYRAVMTEPRALITRRYSKVKGLRARGILSPASAPCEIDGCRNCSPLPDFRAHGTGYVCRG